MTLKKNVWGEAKTRAETAKKNPKLLTIYYQLKMCLTKFILRLADSYQACINLHDFLTVLPNLSKIAC